VIAKMDIDALAKQFSDFYYQTFDADRSQLANLYVPPRPLLFVCPFHSFSRPLFVFFSSVVSLSLARYLTTFLLHYADF
jgi:hypothetical protein